MKWLTVELACRNLEDKKPGKRKNQLKKKSLSCLRVFFFSKSKGSKRQNSKEHKFGGHKVKKKTIHRNSHTEKKTDGRFF